MSPPTHPSARFLKESLGEAGQPPPQPKADYYRLRSEARKAMLGALAPKAKGAQPPGGGGERKNPKLK